MRYLMLKLNCKTADSSVIGEEHGLNLELEFNNYAEKVADIIKNLNQRKDKPGERLQWMNLGYNCLVCKRICITCRRKI